MPFWSAALGYQPAGSLDGFEVLQPREGEPPGPVFILQRVPEPKTGKNRSHLDIHPPLERGVPSLVEELVALGGRRIGEPVVELVDELGIWWQVMATPRATSSTSSPTRVTPSPDPPRFGCCRGLCRSAIPRPDRSPAAEGP